MSEQIEIGKELTFRIYGTTVKGKFISRDGNQILIETTQDFACEIGEEQTINSAFLVSQ